MPDTTKPVPPAGTKTHKPTCGCIQCKAKRYDERCVQVHKLISERDELKAERDELKAERDELKAERDELRRFRETHLDNKAPFDTAIENLAKVVKPEEIDLSLWGLAWTAAYIDQVTAKTTDLIQRCDLYKGQAERTGEANTRLQTENKELTDEVKHLVDQSSLTADELGAALAEVERLEKNLAAFTKAHLGVAGQLDTSRAENTELRTQLTQSADTLRQEQNASRGAVLIVLIVTALVTCTVSFLIGRFGR